MSNPTTAIQKVSPKSELATLLESRREALSQVLPQHITPDRMVKVALLCVNKNPLLKKCTPASVFAAVMQAAEAGLELGTQAHLVPYFNSKESRYDAQYQPDYKGLVALVRRSGQVLDVQANEVYKDDLFEYEFGFDPKLRHRPSEKEDAGVITHFYACFRYKDGGRDFVVMPVAKVNKIRDASLAKSKGHGPWKDHYVEMGKKTALKRLCKLAPTSREVADAVQADDVQFTRDTGMLADMDFSVPADPRDLQQPSAAAPEAEDAQFEPAEPARELTREEKLRAKFEAEDREESPSPAPESKDPSPMSSVLKAALKKIEAAKKASDEKALADAASYVKENLKGDEHTTALQAYQTAKTEISGAQASVSK